jgi:hypothetical protein
LSVTWGRFVVFSNPPIFSIYKTDRHDITEILLKVTIHTIKQTNNQYRYDTIFVGDNLYFYSEQLCPLHLYHSFNFLNCLKINIYYDLCFMITDVLKKYYYQGCDIVDFNLLIAQLVWNWIHTTCTYLIVVHV